MPASPASLMPSLSTSFQIWFPSFMEGAAPGQAAPSEFVTTGPVPT